MSTEILAMTIVIGGFLVGLIAVCIIAALLTAIIWQLFPNCAYSKWVKAEVFQEEHLTFKSEQQDWLSKRMNK